MSVFCSLITLEKSATGFFGRKLPRKGDTPQRKTSMTKRAIRLILYICYFLQIHRMFMWIFLITFPHIFHQCSQASIIWKSKTVMVTEFWKHLNSKQVYQFHGNKLLRMYLVFLEGNKSMKQQASRGTSSICQPLHTRQRATAEL